MVLEFQRLKMLLVISAFVVGLVPPPLVVAVPGLLEVFSAATAAISAGTSLAGTTLQGLAQTEYRVTVAIQVDNWTRFPLLYPTARLAAGYLTVAPTEILPGVKEGFSARKADHTATGTYGTVSWEVAGVSRRFVLMWSAPFNFDHHSNWMGVGMTRRGITHVPSWNTWFDQMYYGDSSNDLHFERSEFYYVSDPVIYRDNDFEIVGVMTNVHQAQIKVIFRPVLSKLYNLAPAISQILANFTTARR